MVEGAAFVKASDWQEARAPGRGTRVRGCGQSMIGCGRSGVAPTLSSTGNSRLRYQR